ncbi:hypothetical protein, partial [Streptomyces sp. NPDC096153]|uniref:hypothetical protein n=1 Tax=Streptomyces sp. NPDC096153 TaxID=3155548 RepID=UPI003326D5CE
MIMLLGDDRAMAAVTPEPMPSAADVLRARYHSRVPERLERTLSPFLVAASSGLGEEALAGEASEAAAG